MKKVFIGFLLIVTMMLTINVNAKVMSKDDIDDDSYVIGSYLFTRAHNSDDGYNGELTTQVMLLAAQSIESNNGLEDMIVYYKTFLGEWINGITGEEITPPSYFEITNQNLKEALASPYQYCTFIGHNINCITTLTTGSVLSPTVYYGSDGFGTGKHNNLDFDGGVEFYVLKNNQNEYATDILQEYNPVYSNYATPELIDLYGDWNPDTFYQVVSRFYYNEVQPDSTVKKVYSEYSNISSNGMRTIFGLIDSSGVSTGSGYVGLNVTTTNNRSVEVDDQAGMINGDVTYYNVKFNLTNVDTNNYLIKKYKVYGLNNAFNSYVSNRNLITSAEDYGNSSFQNYFDTIYSKKYKKSYRFLGNLNENYYLAAEINGVDAFGEINDVSATQVASKVVVPQEGELGNYLAEFVMCDKTDTTRCITYYCESD